MMKINIRTANGLINEVIPVSRIPIKGEYLIVNSIIYTVRTVTHVIDRYLGSWVDRGVSVLIEEFNANMNGEKK